VIALTDLARHPDLPLDQNAPARVACDQRPDRTLAASLIVLFALAVLPYLNTLFNGFVYDDDTQVLNNPYILNFSHLHAIFTTTVWSYVGKQGLTNYYRPIMTLGYLICHELFGMLAYGYHLMNVLLYGGVTLLLFAVTERMFKRRGLAFLAAAVFALEPVHTESVAWIAGVTELELTFFFLLAFYFFLRLPKGAGGLSDAAMLGMMASFLLALLSKEQAVMFPALATFYEHTGREDRHDTSGSAKLARYGPLWLLTAAYLIFRVSVLGGLAPVVQLPHLTWRAAFLSGLALVAQYTAKLFWPAHLCAFYVFHASSRLTDPGVMAGIGVLGAGLALFIVFWNRNRRISFALAWFIATLAPVLNARWMAGNVFTERYLVLPSAGFCWMVAWVGMQGWDAAGAKSRRLRPMTAAAACLIAIAAAARIVIRNRDWCDDVTLYTKTLAQSPGAYQILNNLGTVDWRQGRIEEARQCWERALQLRPTQSIFLDNLGLYYSRKNNFAEAESYLRRAILLKPEYTEAHLNLGSIFRKQGDWKEAELQLKAAVALSPLNPDTHNEMAKLDLDTGRAAEAEAEFRKSLDASPNLTALDGLGKMEMQAGRLTQARIEFRKALTLDNSDSRAYFGMAAIDAAAGLFPKAIAEYEAGLRTDPKNALALAALKKLKSNVSYDEAIAH